MKEPTEKATLVSEFLGTLILCFTVACVIIGKNNLGCLSIAAALMTSIYAMGPVSGGHFNPAVTTGVLVAATSNHDGVNLPVSLAVRYWFVQFIAGFFGVLLATMTYASHAGGFVGVDRVGGLEHAEDFAGLALKDPTFGVFFSELFFTALLVFTVLSVATTKDFKGNTNEANNFYFALAIGFTIVAGANAIGPISGCALNPAVSFGLAMGSIIQADVGFGDAFVNWLVYAIAEVLGGCLAFGFFNLARPQFDPSKADFKRRAFAEFLGSFYLVLTFAFVVMTGSPVPPLGFAGIASALMVLTYSLRSVSGAHFNPAVSVAAFLIEDRMTPVQTRKEDKFAVLDLAAYVASQLVGGVLAVCTAGWLQPARPFALVRDFALRGGMNNTYSESLDSHVGMARGTWGAIVGAEIFFTFLLVFVTLSVSVGNTPNQYYGLAIGFVVIAGGLAVGGLSGGCFNPAVSFALDIDASWTQGSACGYGWIYILCQLVAGALAAAVYLGVRGTDSKDGRKAAAEETEQSTDDSGTEG